MKVKVGLSQNGWRNGEVEIEVGDQPNEEAAVDVAYMLAEDVKYTDPRVKWGDWNPAFREYPDPDNITIIKPIG